MGCPLSPILAKIFMNYIEEMIEKHKLFHLFKFWYRYVDDVIALFTGSDRQLNQFFTDINKLNTNIIITIEKKTITVCHS